MDILKVLVYGDINLNIIDGSAVWLTSMLNVLSVNNKIKIDLLLKTPIKSTEMVDSVYKYKDINKIEMFTNGNKLTAEDAVKNMVKLNEANNYECIIIRGFDLSMIAVREKELRDKLICYITNFEHDDNKISNEEREKLKFVYNNCEYFCAQTPEAMECLKKILDINEDRKFIILNPMIPDYEQEEPNFENKNNRLIYSGKFAKDWYTSEIINSFVDMAKENCEMNLTVVGNLFRADLNDEKENILNVLNNNNNVNWIKGVNRTKSNALIKDSDIGIAWRSRNIDNDKSVELSTKVLEYCRAGKPILLNRIKMYENLLGKDYPLFIEDDSEFEEKVKLALTDEIIYKECAEKVHEVGKRYTFSESYKRLHHKLWSFKSTKTKLVFAGHDLKFIQQFIDH
ncbi:MAG: glycosyltransferase, partial [Clostridium sp.]